MFTVKGKLLNKPYSITYDAGRLTGDRLIVDLVNMEARLKEGQPVGPVGQYTDSNHLQDPLSALFIIQDVFTSVDEVTGDIPEADEVPEGAIV